MNHIKTILFWLLISAIIVGIPLSILSFGHMSDDAIRRAADACKEYGMTPVPYVRPVDGRITGIRCKEPNQ